MNQVQNNGQPNVQQVFVQQPQGNGLAVTGLVLGILGLVFFWLGWFGILLGILAIIFGGIGASKPIKRGMGIAGVVLGILAIALPLLLAGLLAAAFISSF